MNGLPYVRLYKASIDGWAPKDFHGRCDKKGPTLVIMKSKVGKVFGGFCMIGW